MILRVRGSSWELKIDPERVEEENKHVLEEDKSQRRCQESRKMPPRSYKVTMYLPCRVIMSSQNGLSVSDPGKNGVQPEGREASLDGRSP